jgi:hypothetical protein
MLPTQFPRFSPVSAVPNLPNATDPDDHLKCSPMAAFKCTPWEELCNLVFMRKRRESILVFIAAAIATFISARPVHAQDPFEWNFHVQNTDVVRGDPGFPAKYSGPNSLSSNSQVQETVTLDVYSGLRLWSGAEAYVDGLMWQGFGLSQTFGIEDFPNGDAFKAGTKVPTALCRTSSSGKPSGWAEKRRTFPMAVLPFLVRRIFAGSQLLLAASPRKTSLTKTVMGVIPTLNL